MDVVVIDYNICNLGSIRRSLEECGANVIISRNPEDLYNASKVILPGVGAFDDGIKNLQENNWIPALQSQIIEKKIPLLGICLGMQLLAEKSYEGGAFDGLGFIPGEVKKLIAQKENERIPHIGWNEVHITHNHTLFEGIEDNSDFYFVHSYNFICSNTQNTLSKTPYCGDFISAIQQDNIMGVQFHPEKSQNCGLQLLKNFLNL